MNPDRKFRDYMAQVSVESDNDQRWVNYEVRVKLISLLQICLDELNGNKYRILGYDKVTCKWYEVFSSCNDNIVHTPLEIKRANICKKGDYINESSVS